MKYTVCFALISLCALLYLVNQYYLDDTEYDTYLMYSRICFIGQREKSIVKMMGVPLKAYSKDIAYPQFCQSGYHCAPMKNSHKMYVYYDIIMIYILIEMEW